jgi:hypothetical protein
MSHFAEMNEDEKLAAEEARLQRHGSKADWNKGDKLSGIAVSFSVLFCRRVSLPVVTKVVSPRTKPKETVGPRVVVYWLDRQTGNRVVEPISVHLDGYSMRS